MIKEEKEWEVIQEKVVHLQVQEKMVIQFFIIDLMERSFDGRMVEIYTNVGQIKGYREK